MSEETLALCQEGLLSRRRTTRIRGHLARCPRCADVDAELTALPTMLALTAAAPMPPQLAARIEAVIAAEAATRRSDAVDAGSGPGPARRPARRRLGVPQKVLAYAAAAVVLIAGGGFLLARQLSATPGSATSSAAAPATAEGPEARAGANAAAGAAGITIISSGTDYRSGHLAAQVAAVLAGSAASPAGGVRVPGPAQQALMACVTRIAAGQRPRLVDESRYDGRPATVIVLAATAHGLEQVWVVGPACSGSRGDVMAHATLPGSG